MTFLANHLRPAAILAAACLVTAFLAPLAAAKPPGRPACNDGADNDGDGLIDYPADPGCSSANDTDEYNAPPPPSNTCDGAVTTGPVVHPRPWIASGTPPFGWPRLMLGSGTVCAGVGGGASVCQSDFADTDGSYQRCSSIVCGPDRPGYCGVRHS